MIKLGHIGYSNCFPVHAAFIAGERPSSVQLVTGTPAQLNQALASGAIDVAPASSIEYARHADAYRLLPDFVIASDGPVGSILLESTRPLAELGNKRIAVPTASATSVVLLKILMRCRSGVQADYFWFDQDSGADPFDAGADAALWIGDVALRRVFGPDRHQYDLGAEWQAWLGLPFVFAAWQTSAAPERDAELRTLNTLLRDSRRYFLDNAAALAKSTAPHFRIDAGRLLRYWQSLRYDFDESMQRGLLEYYRLAASLGEAPAVTRLKWLA
jgi:chorismate dehydratase